MPNNDVVVYIHAVRVNLDLQDEVNAIPCICAHEHVHVLVNVTQSITFFVDFCNWLCRLSQTITNVMQKYRVPALYTHMCVGCTWPYLHCTHN